MNLSELAKLGTAGVVNIIIRVAGVIVILGGEIALRRHLAAEGVRLPPSFALRDDPRTPAPPSQRVEKR
ncbi:hypothetical protein [Actinomyces gaoshouyii]|nr:hypothetical protein [Actinomyces gaoshouyii]